MKKYNLVNNIFGWLSFAIAAVTYLLTIEPTASFWDCGEFITSAYKLEVGHPPGAPFFMLTGNFFSQFASDPTQVAKMVNSMSALLSALTILFLFWTITHLAKKLIYQDTEKEMTAGQMIAIIGSGLVGALAYTFSDTFWFSAVEGEVYAYSSMFTALVFWLILKWENRADRPGSDKWLVLIAYMMGLSIGVHLLNLLCIPAIVLVYYFKKVENPSFKGILLSLIGAGGLILVLMYGIIPGLTKVGGGVELFFVNSLSLPYNSGVFVYLILLFITIVWGIYESFSPKGSLQRAKIAFIIAVALSGITFIGSNEIVWLLLLCGLIVFTLKGKAVTFRFVNTSLLCLLVILIGYSSFALIPIRSTANTPMDQNSPEDVFSLTDYLNREQYGDNPLFYGRTYASEVNKEKMKDAPKKKKYSRIIKSSPEEKDRYYVSSEVPTYEYTKTMLFPRMYSSDHMRGYHMWGGVTDSKVPPTFLQNIRYMISYQVNFMYWRYFMWNFSGRQNDIQSRGEISNGNWMTGIGFIDEHVLGLGPQDDLPADIAENKGHNVYYMLPLILGIIGIIYQLTRGKKGEQQLWITFMLFFMTGLAIVLYLNQKPEEPRERDYAYAGSFYAFCIWIGLGVAALWTLAKKYIPEQVAAITVTIIALLVPIQMATQNWDDHDRSNRYTMRDFGKNYLRSIEKDGIIFTNGDNDTFPLWYAQEVEGFRTDVRVTNLSYLQTDWYVDQMRRDAYDSPALPIEWDRSHYSGDKGMYAYIITKNQMDRAIRNSMGDDIDPWNKAQVEQGIQAGNYYDRDAYKDTIMLDAVMETLRTKDNYVPKNPYIDSNEKVFIIPSNKLYMPVDTAAVNWEKLGVKPAESMVMNLGNKDAIYRHEIMILEMLNNINKDNWQRPIYFATTVGSDMYMNMRRSNFMLEGMAYRITPKADSTGVNTEVAYDNMVNKFEWGGIENPNVYLDENNMRMCKSSRIFFGELISALIRQGKNDKALSALDHCVKVIPSNTVPMGSESIPFAEYYYQLGEKKKGDNIVKIIMDRNNKTLTWYNRLSQNQMASSMNSIRELMENKIRMAMIYQDNEMPDEYKKMMTELLNYAPFYYDRGLTTYTNDGELILFGDYLIQNIAGIAYRNLINQETDTETKMIEQSIYERAEAILKDNEQKRQKIKYYNP